MTIPCIAESIHRFLARSGSPARPPPMLHVDNGISEVLARLTAAQAELVEMARRLGAAEGEVERLRDHLAFERERAERLSGEVAGVAGLKATLAALRWRSKPSGVGWPRSALSAIGCSTDHGGSAWSGNYPQRRYGQSLAPVSRRGFFVRNDEAANVVPLLSYRRRGAPDRGFPLPGTGWCGCCRRRCRT